MKKIYTFILILGMIQQTSIAQTYLFEGFDFDNLDFSNLDDLDINININIGDSFDFGDFDLYGTNPCPGCIENINNFTFTTNSSFDNAVANEILVNRAIEAGNTDWYNEQTELIRQHLEEKFNTPFDSFNDAKDALFLHSEQGNITRNSAEPISRYSSLESHGYGVSRGYLRELKLIQIRRAEIDAGNLNNPQYGYLSIDGTAIKDITDLQTLDQKWSTIATPLGENFANTHENKYILEKLLNLGADFDTEVVELKNSYYNSFDFWEKINYMQFLINYEEIKRLTSAPYYYPELIQLFNKFVDTDKATTPLIEAHAIQYRAGGRSVFDAYYNLYGPFYNLWLGREDRTEAIWQVNRYKGYREEAINNLLNDTSTEDFAIENLIAELGITDTDQKNWLFAHAAEASLMVAFLDANRVNGVATAEAKSFSRAAVEALMNGAEVDFDEQVINELTGLDKCIYDKLKELNLFKNTVGKFTEGRYNLTFTYSGVCNGGAGEEACTDPADLENGNITIKLLSSALPSQKLDFATTILHEGIHAEIYKYVKQYNESINPNERSNLFYYYKTYKAQNSNDFATAIAQHQHMQDIFVVPIAKAIRELDNNRFPLEDYYGFAWEGLNEDYDYDQYLDGNGQVQTMTTAYYNQLINRKNEIISTSSFASNCN